MNIGDDIIRLARNARDSVTLIAPFIKTAALARLLESVPSEVPVTIYTRWRLQEIASGVSDIDVWRLVAHRQKCSMNLCQQLHAKCYVFDTQASIGSANITLKALGWHGAPNLELQTLVPSTDKCVTELLQIIRLSSTVVTQEIADAFENLVRQLTVVDPREPYIAQPASPIYSGWLPYTRQPSELFHVYSGKIHDVSSHLMRAAEYDLDYIALPSGLNRSEFDSCVTAVLMQHPLFARIHDLSTVPRRFGEYRSVTREFLAEHNSDRDPTDAWQTCLRWLLHFMSDRYRLQTPNYSEILVRTQQ